MYIPIPHSQHPHASWLVISFLHCSPTAPLSHLPQGALLWDFLLKRGLTIPQGEQGTSQQRTGGVVPWSERTDQESWRIGTNPHMTGLVKASRLHQQQLVAHLFSQEP
jgi:hypothetical protein